MSSSFFQPRTAGTKTKEKRVRLVPWVEKYRPKCVNDIAHQDEAVESIKGAIQTGNVPHLLFYGPPGTGKTSTILAMAHELFGAELFEKRVLELNASDERGIKVIRDKVKHFASSKVSKDVVNGKPAPPFKLIILDEADSMTGDAQSALRRTMEKFTKVTRFCLICNYVSRIIEPLASRCAKFRFQPLNDASMRQRLETIRDAEGVTCDADTVDVILEHSHGDMRKAITLLQSAAQYGQNVVTSDAIVELSGSVPQRTIDGLFEILKTNNYAKLDSYIDDIIADGFSAGIFLEQFYDTVMTRDDISDTQKAHICIKLAASDKAIEVGASEELQMMDVAATSMKILNQAA